MTFSPRDQGHNRSNQRGFTLIEVLIALVILTIGLLGVIVALGQAARFDSRFRDQQAAHWIAETEASGLQLHFIQAPSSGKPDDRQLKMMHRSWVAEIETLQQKKYIDWQH